MEFWGAEVKSGQNFEVALEDDGSRILHLSQVALGEGTDDNKKEKGKETICLYLKFKNEKFVVGTLSQEKCPQIALDLVLHDKFELSHTGKNGSVYVTGYYVDTSQGSDTESEEDLPEPTMNLVKSEPAASDPTTTKQVKIVEPKKDDDSSDEDEESSEEQEPRMLVNGENDSDDADSDEDDSEEDSSDEDQKTPEKAGPSKKRPAESSKKTPAPEKKAKLVTPQKTDSKKAGGHTATPHPSKKAGKTSAAAAAAQVKQTPKSGGSFPCKSCGRSFGSENALQSHSKAKHGTQA
ncbi:histone deacetylase HDT1-like isoform X42 [Gossypium raimondii]|uniref:histone deacetylase HDT1-like isoform X42 n=1 Tax=Gossypium raimondii TaxID=29730 RepID=UPI00227A3076|nr:histone deacetylase HDT1-like isoform X42 [Gossypium raimondii]